MRESCRDGWVGSMIAAYILFAFGVIGRSGFIISLAGRVMMVCSLQI